MANEVKAMGSRLGVIVKTIDGWDIRTIIGPHKHSAATSHSTDTKRH